MNCKGLSASAEDVQKFVVTVLEGVPRSITVKSGEGEAVFERIIADASHAVGNRHAREGAAV